MFKESAITSVLHCFDGVNSSISTHRTTRPMKPVSSTFMHTLKLLGCPVDPMHTVLSLHVASNLLEKFEVAESMVQKKKKNARKLPPHTHCYTRMRSVKCL